MLIKFYSTEAQVLFGALIEMNLLDANRKSSLGDKPFFFFRCSLSQRDLCQGRGHKYAPPLWQ